MARIDLARRAQIGRDRRARTRRALYALTPIEAVTVDDLVGEAVAKKTFYVHFDGLAELPGPGRRPTRARI